jgi:hypothetical protein
MKYLQFRVVPDIATRMADFKRARLLMERM